MISADTRNRKKHVDLKTQQRRLRHLRSVSVLNVNIPNELSERKDVKLYFTLHSSERKHSAFYVSEKTSDLINPKWRIFDPSQYSETVNTSLPVISVKIWASQNGQNILIIDWQVFFNGLHYLGHQVSKNDRKFKSNTIVFGMFEGYYTSGDCIQGIQSSELQKLPSTWLAADPLNIRISCNVSCLQRIHTVQRATKQMQVSIWKLHHLIQDHLQQTQKNEQLLAWKEQQQMTVKLLQEELRMQKIQLLLDRDQFMKMQAGKEELSKQLKEKYEELRKEKLKLYEDKKIYNDSREKLLKTNAQLAFRQKQLISELTYIYPIAEVAGKGYTICGVHLPNSEDFIGHDEVRIAIALGFATHLVSMIAQFLHIPLRYSMKHLGSRSKITDHIIDKIPDKDREFPLFTKGREKFHFNYGVYLLNKNIAQLRYYCGLITQDLRATLPNLQSLLELQLGSKFDYYSMGSQGSGSESRSSVLNLRSNSNARLYHKHLETRLASCERPRIKPVETPSAESEIFSNPVLDSISVKQLSATSEHNKYSKDLKILNSNVHCCSLDKGLDELNVLRGAVNYPVRSAVHFGPKLRWQQNFSIHGSEPNLSHRTPQLMRCHCSEDGYPSSGEDGIPFNPSFDMWGTGSSHTTSDDGLSADGILMSTEERTSHNTDFINPSAKVKLANNIAFGCPCDIPNENVNSSGANICNNLESRSGS